MRAASVAVVNIKSTIITLYPGVSYTAGRELLAPIVRGMLSYAPKRCYRYVETGVKGPNSHRELRGSSRKITIVGIAGGSAAAENRTRACHITAVYYLRAGLWLLAQGLQGGVRLGLCWQYAFQH